MKTVIARILVPVLLTLGGISCATVSHNSVGREVTAATYTQSKATKGVVIFSVNWGRRWGCGAAENAEILSMGFDRLPLADGTGDGTPEVFLDGPPRLLKDPVFVNYALLLEPGEYALSSFDVKVCWSSRPMNIDHFIAKRSDLIEGGYPKAGSFEVLPGEIVYIGNFWLDCYHEPMIWRYYTEGREGFRKHMAEIKQQYPFLDVDNAEYRLFSTTTMGQDYELPK